MLCMCLHCIGCKWRVSCFWLLLTVHAIMSARDLLLRATARKMPALQLHLCVYAVLLCYSACMCTNRYADLIVHRLLLASLSNTTVAIDSSNKTDMAIDDTVSIPESQTPSVMQQQLQSEGMLVDTSSNKQTIQSYTADTFDDLEGDDLLDALLGMDGDTTPNGTATLALPWQNVSDAVKTAAPVAAVAATATEETDGVAEDVVAVQEESSQDKVLSTLELSALCEHLNDRHRSAKQLSTQCQELFLRLYFMVGAPLLLYAIALKTRQHSAGLCTCIAFTLVVYHMMMPWC
jgi:hypothetical protein